MFLRVRQPGRDGIISNVKNLITESTPYAVYRLDIKSFYESFSINDVIEKIESIKLLSPKTKQLLTSLLKRHEFSGGLGLPRGLALSATLSELMMQSFDQAIKSMPAVYFYSRYVDDIIIITNAQENQSVFLREAGELLPNGLEFNRNKKEIMSIFKPVKPESVSRKMIADFEYLGYRFIVHEPLEIKKVQKYHYARDVDIDIAESKVKKIKTRIIKSIIDFVKNGDSYLLQRRICYLTTNFSVMDKNKERKRLAGIYYNYHKISVKNSNALAELDVFLRACLVSNRGAVFSGFRSKITKIQRQRLLTYSFKNGFEKKVFMHFSPKAIHEIQECWEYV